MAQELAPGVFVETTLRRVNVGAILTRAGLVLIDTPPYPDDALAWRAQLRNLSDLPVLAIINTDCHTDRILGNGWFDARVIVAHDDTMARLQNLPASFWDSAIDGLTQTAAERSRFSSVPLRVPTVGFTRRMQLRYGEREISLIAMPGPTAGSLWIPLSDERIVFVGDSVVTNQHPYISSASTKAWMDSLTILRRPRFAADWIVPGRGPLVTKENTEAISHYLRLARRRVQSLYRAGHPRADTVALVPELLELFPYNENDLESVQRRIKIGLDRIYEEIKNNDWPEE
jgi:glyoxylase-like metal-dependent hydrolase (beta-lactamase superfamily II)